MADYPGRGSKNWDVTLKKYIDEASNEVGVKPGSKLEMDLSALMGTTAYDVAFRSRVSIAGPPPQTIKNLVANPRLVTDATGWANSGYGTGGAGSGERVAGAGPFGDAAWVTTWTTAPTGGAANFGPYSDRSPVTPGDIRSADLWVHATQAMTLSLVTGWWAAASGGSPIQQDQSQVSIPANEWVRIAQSPSTAAPAGAAYASAYVRSNNLSDAGTGTLKVARAMLSSGPGVKPYRDSTITESARGGFGVAWGDSMTQTAHGGGSHFPAHLARLLGIGTVLNYGRGGEPSLGIAIRQGGVQAVVTFPSDSMPASGSATVTVTPSTFYGTNGTWNFQGSVAGVDGTLSRAPATGVWTWTRSTAGSAVALLAGGTPFRVRTAQDYADFATIWIGANNIDSRTFDEVLSSTGAMTARCEATGQPYVVLSVLNTQVQPAGSEGHTFVTKVNAALSGRYGGRFLNVRRYLIDRGLSVAGITPTTADTTAINEDRVPPSLMADSIHLNDAGRQVVAKVVAQYLASVVYVPA